MQKGSLNPQNPEANQVPLGAASMAVESEIPKSLCLDPAIANCSRLLLDSIPAEQAVPRALADLVAGLNASHATLFQIKSYHMEDYRGQWLACSSAGDCIGCRDIRDWDFLQLIDTALRFELEAGRSCRISTSDVFVDFKQVLTERDVGQLLVLPLMVMGKWWGCLCIEQAQDISAEIPAARSDLATLAALFSIYYERRQAVEGCQERDKLSGALEMAGTVCHKLNQPMQVILGYASMVTSGDIRDPEQIGEIVQLIEDETRQMGIITKNLMGITKHHRTAQDATSGNSL